MSALATWCIQKGWKVQGSTHKPNGLSDALARQGAHIFHHHDTDNLHAQLGGVVYSTDISPDHIELAHAHTLGLPLWHRSDFLRAIVQAHKVLAVTGSHGKTSTTSLLGHLLATAQTDPLIVAGGHMQALGTSCYAGSGPWAVIEADESDRSHLNFSTLHTALLTHVGTDHLWHYGHCQEQLKTSFQEYLKLAEHSAVVCRDRVDPAMIPHDLKGALVWYGLDPASDIRASHIRFSPQGLRWDCHTPLGLWKDLFLPLYGEHNIVNALGCVAAGLSCGLLEDSIRQGLLSFQGVNRRMTPIGSYQGIPLIDDYAQHPTAIATVLKALHQHGYRRILAVCQPHRYRRLRTLFDDYARSFHHAASVVILPVYAAGEPVCPQGTSSVQLVDAMLSQGHHNRVAYSEPDQLWPHIQSDQWDVVVFLGAGDITEWAKTYRTHDHLEHALCGR